MHKIKLVVISVLSLLVMVTAVGCGDDAAWVFGSNHEYATRDDGLEGVEETYGFNFDEVDIMDTGITYGALRDGEVHAAMGFATDGRVAGFDLVTLEDDMAFHPVYNAAPNLREDVYEDYPELEEILFELSQILDNESIQELNARVDIEEEEPEEVAEDFLGEEGLINGAGDNVGDGASVSVGSKEFTEQLILGQLTILLLEEHGFDVEDNTGLGGTDVLRQALEDGDVDIKWEYTGTALISHLGHDEAITDSEECYQVVKEEDLAENGVVWLDYSEIDNTYTIMMREEDAEELGIQSISDLADAINEGVEPPSN